MRVTFNQELHEYRNEDNVKYLSVTQLISKFKIPFDTQKEAQKYVVNHPEYPMTVEQCLYAWDFLCDFALEKGNYYHDKKELEALYQSAVVDWGYNDDPNFDINNLITGLYPELRIYDHELELAGHADRVDIELFDLENIKGEEFLPYKGYIDIEDYKTYKDEVTKKSFRDQRLKHPLNDIPDANFFHAALQLNLYAYMMKRKGYIPRKLQIHHKPYDDRKPIPADKFIPFISEEEQRKPKIYSIKYNEPVILRLIKYYEEELKGRS